MLDITMQTPPEAPGTIKPKTWRVRWWIRALLLAQAAGWTALFVLLPSDGTETAFTWVALFVFVVVVPFLGWWPMIRLRSDSTITIRDVGGVKHAPLVELETASFTSLGLRFTFADRSSITSLMFQQTLHGPRPRIVTFIETLAHAATVNVEAEDVLYGGVNFAAARELSRTPPSEAENPFVPVAVRAGRALAGEIAGDPVVLAPVLPYEGWWEVIVNHSVHGLDTALLRADDPTRLEIDSWKVAWVSEESLSTYIAESIPELEISELFRAKVVDRQAWRPSWRMPWWIWLFALVLPLTTIVYLIREGYDGMPWWGWLAAAGSSALAIAVVWWPRIHAAKDGSVTVRGFGPTRRFGLAEIASLRITRLGLSIVLGDGARVTSSIFRDLRVWRIPRARAFASYVAGYWLWSVPDGRFQTDERGDDVMYRAVEVSIPEDVVVDGDVAELEPGAVLALGLRLATAERGVRLDGVVTWVRDSPELGYAEFVLDTGDVAVLLDSRELPSTPVIGSEFSARGALSLIRDYEYDAFDLPDVRSAWIVRSARYQGPGYLADLVVAGPVGAAPGTCSSAS